MRTALRIPPTRPYSDSLQSTTWPPRAYVLSALGGTVTISSCTFQVRGCAQQARRVSVLELS